MGVDNVGFRQVQAIRISLHVLIVVLIGKDFMTRNVIRENLKKSSNLEKLRASARAGVFAPLKVINTALGSEKTSFFQAVLTPNKIFKGTIEIINVVPKVGAFEATLAAKDEFKEAKTINEFIKNPLPSLL